jgi:hypothetical protein
LDFFPQPSQHVLVNVNHCHGNFYANGKFLMTNYTIFMLLQMETEKQIVFKPPVLASLHHMVINSFNVPMNLTPPPPPIPGTFWNLNCTIFEEFEV